MFRVNNKDTRTTPMALILLNHIVFTSYWTYFRYFWYKMDYFFIETIELVRTQTFSKNYYFLPSDTPTYVWLLGVKNASFFLKKISVY